MAVQTAYSAAMGAARAGILAVESKTDAFRVAMQDRKPNTENGNGQTDYEKRLNDAWKGSAK